MKRFSSIQRRLLKEAEGQEEIELDIPEGDDTEPAPPKNNEEDLGEIPLEEPEGEESPTPESSGEEGQDKINLITGAVDDLDQMKAKLNKIGLLAAMHFSDYSTQRRLEAVADEIGEVVKHLNDKVLKAVSKSPMDMERTTNWLSGGSDEA